MKTLIRLLVILLCTQATAQLPTDFRSEQIYLNTEKHCYLPGDTIALEGVVTCMAGERFLPYSNYLYIECFNEQDSLLSRQKVSCKEQGYFSTHLPTEYVWPAGVYYLRAYTQLMRNFSTESFAQQPFLLGLEFPKKEKQIYEARCSIIPSGGKLVPDYPQTVAVRLTDECTFPVSTKLMLKNDKGDTISYIQTSQFGMASLRFIPKSDTQYHLAGNIDGKDYRFPLPDIVDEIKIQGTLNGKRLNYQILKGKETEGLRIYTFDRQNGLTCTEVNREHGILMMEHAPEVITLFLTDENNQVLSEYTVAGKLNHNVGLQAPATIKTNDSINWTLETLPEGAIVMTRIVKNNDLLVSNAESMLKYLSDYTSTLPFPQHSGNNDIADYRNDLHTWLSTARFHRFKLTEVLEKDTALYAFVPEQVMSFSGKIEKKTKRPLKGGQLVAYHTTNDFVYDVPLVSDSARFHMAVDDFMEGEEFFLQAITSKEKPDFANYHIDDDTFPAIVNNRRFNLPTSRYADTEVVIGNTLNLQYTVGKDNIRNYTLPNVTVKARLKTEESKPTHEFYSTNYADREEIEERAYGTLYDILRTMPGIRVSFNPIPNKITTMGSGGGSRMTDYMQGKSNAGSQKESQYVIESSRGKSTLSSGGIPIIVDNAKFTQSDYDFILTMPAHEIESVELLRAWQTLAYTFGAIDGAILVKTRTHKDRPPLPSKGVMYSPIGLSPLSYPFKEYLAQPQPIRKPGHYRLIVDVITHSDVQSYEHTFEVVEETNL